jgi:hypothetical protein
VNRYMVTNNTIPTTSMPAHRLVTVTGTINILGIDPIIFLSIDYNRLIYFNKIRELNKCQASLRVRTLSAVPVSCIGRKGGGEKNYLMRPSSRFASDFASIPNSLNS